MRWNLAHLAKMVEGKIDGDPNIEIEGVAGLENVFPGALVFAETAKAVGVAEASAASVLLLHHDGPKTRKTALRVENPRLAFAKIANLFLVDPFRGKGISEEACIHPAARLGENVDVHPLAVIEEEAVIGDNTVIGHGSFIGHRCKLGNNVMIYPGVKIVAATEIGDNTIIHSGAVIGCDGFGYINTPGGHYKMPQLGKVVIERDVEIGANTVIDRAAITETRIKKGTKIDGLVMIGHNVVIGEDCILVGQTGVAGSSRLGSGVILGGQVGIADHVCLGDNVLVGAKSGVTKDLPGSGQYFGIPAQKLQKAFKNQAVFNRLSRYRQEIKSLKERLAALEERVKGEE